MNITIPKAVNSIWSGLITGAIITSAVFVPTMVNAQAQSSVKASAQSELKDQTNQWSDNNTANAGDTLKYIINYQNVGNAGQDQVTIRATLPANVTLVPGTTMIYNAASTAGVKAPTDTVTTDTGVNVGDYGPGANAYVVFQAQIAAADKLTCGDNQLKLNGSVQPKDAEKTSVSTVTTVKRDCAAKPAPAATTTPPASTTPTATTPAPAVVTPATPPAATTPVAPAANASGALPNTGAGDVFAIFGVAAVAGFIGHKFFLSRRFSR